MGPVTSTLRWDDLALDLLLPVDREKAEAERAVLARETAAGNIQNQNPRAEEEDENQG